MSNPYYTRTNLVSHALGRSGVVNAQLQAVEEGFDAVYEAIASTGSGTSSTSNSIASSGSKTFTLTSGSFSIGQFVLFADTLAPSNWMFGQVTDFDTETQDVVATILDSGGSGIRSSWSLSLVPPGYESSYFTTLVDEKADHTDGIMTRPTLVNPILTGSPVDDTYTITDGAAFEIDPANGAMQRVTLGASRTPKFSNFANGHSIVLKIKDGTGYTVTWTDATAGGSGVVWKNGSAPTLDGTNWTVIVLEKESGQVYGYEVGTVA